MSVFIHETAIVENGAELGDGTKVWHWVHICPGAKIGRGCSFGQNVYVGSKVTIGNNVKVQNNVSIYDAVSLEDDVFCGPSMVFTNVFNPRSHIVRKNEYRPTIVRKGATIGANATIVCGAEVGSYALIGAGAVVTRPVPAYALMMGVPARRLGWVCACGERLPNGHGDITCLACHQKYRVSSESCQPC